MESKKFSPLIAIILTVIIWGFSFLSIKVSLRVFPPMTLALTRFIMASVLLFLFIKWKEPRVRLAREDWPLMFLAGVVGVTCYFYFENNGVKLITASSASIIIATIPIFSLIADAIVYKTTLTPWKIFCVFLSVCGVYLVVAVEHPKLQLAGSGLGYLMMFGAALAWVFYCIATKPLFKKYSQLAIVYYQTLFGTVAFIPFALFEKTNWHLATGTIILNVVYMGVFCSALAYFLYVYSLDKLGINVSSIFLNLIPVVTVIASAFILKEVIKPMQVIGGVLVIISVTLANWENNEPIASPEQNVSQS